MTERRWYQDAVIYQLHVRAFADSRDDGVGDFRGLIHKLDYLRDLGVTALWLLPFYPSPLKDDGYDIADYTDVHPAYGTLRDFRLFLREAHQRDLRVVTELVLNHTSDQHPWFQRARRAMPGSRYRDWYVWSDTPDRYRDARIIFKDFEQSNWAWDPIARAYYWHRFYSHQPDLNFDNPAVHRAVVKAVDFWLDLGVDGLRLDAVPYLYEREGTNCENLPETHEFLKKLRRHVDRKYGDRMLLAEANQWPDDAVAYFGDGDECHMAFHFPLMPRLFIGIHTEDQFPVVDILQQTPSLPQSAQWAVFLRNHDELTLEMVTDEDRDYMYRVYAQDPRARINLGIRRRLAPLMGNNRRKIELMNSLLFSLPGTPIIYYGDEIGMGDNIYLGDRNGVRTPMQWSADRNAGFSRANPQRLFLPVIIDPEYHFETVNVEAQQHNPQSFLWWMKRLIAQRKRNPVLGAGAIEFLPSDNRRVLAFLRASNEDRLLVVANLSRFVQCAELDLAPYEGVVPVEVFGQTRFPQITRAPYFLSLAPHSFYWLALEHRPEESAATPMPVRPAAVTVTHAWEQALEQPAVERVERALMRWLPQQRWCGAAATNILGVHVAEAIRITANGESHVLALLQVSYTEGDPDICFLPLAYATGDEAERQLESGGAVIRIRRRNGAEEGVLYHATPSGALGRWILDWVPSRRRLRGVAGVFATTALKALRDAVKEAEPAELEPSPLVSERHHSSVAFGGRLILKLFRQLDDGMSPELEVGRFLTTRAPFPHTPALVGAVEYLRPEREPLTLGVVQEFIPNVGDGWRYTIDSVDHFFETVLARNAALALESGQVGPLVSEDPPSYPPFVVESMGMYLEATRLLGQRTAELHSALASRSDEPGFAAEPFTPLYQRSLYQSLRAKADQSLNLLAKRMRGLPAEVRESAEAVLAARDAVTARFRAITQRAPTGMRIRCHGNYHLGKVLHTGRDFVIFDFRGEPSRTLGERRLKRSPLIDVAAMVRSFDYAAVSALFDGRVRPEDRDRLQAWAEEWRYWVSRTFVDAYLRTPTVAALVPKSFADVRLLLDCYQLEKALLEVAYELNFRPQWTWIPLRRIREILEGAEGATQP